jgi:CRISPR system Cascade subunit CasD
VHTTQVPDSLARLKHLYTRRDETLDRGNLYTILSSRDYRCDALYTVCLWSRGDKASHPLETLAEALRRPQLPLYLGRKSCPLALPLTPAHVTAKTLNAALREFDRRMSSEQREFFAQRHLDRLMGGVDCYWEDDAAVDPGATQYVHSTPRQDLPLSRRRWQFGKRDEHFGRIQGG